MLVWIDPDCCTGAGLCVDHCPDLFVVLEDGIGYVHDHGAVIDDPTRSGTVVAARLERAVIDAAERCPGECIHLALESPHPRPVDDSDIVDAKIIPEPL